MLRTILERLLRGTYFKRKLPARFNYSPIYVSPDAQLKYLKIGEGAFDKSLLFFIDSYVNKKSIVWDIGANIGVFSICSASIVEDGEVLVVEADLWLSQIIKKSISLKKNKLLNINVLTCAVSDINGVSQFNIAKRGRASNALDKAGGRSQAGGVREQILVPTLTLDTILENTKGPTIVKIDVEGAEILVLKGAKKLLSDIRPIFYIEVGKESNNEVSEIFLKNGYLLFDGTKDLKNQKSTNKCFFNTLAIHKDYFDKLKLK